MTLSQVVMGYSIQLYYMLQFLMQQHVACWLFEYIFPSLVATILAAIFPFVLEKETALKLKFQGQEQMFVNSHVGGVRHFGIFHAKTWLTWRNGLTFLGFRAVCSFFCLFLVTIVLQTSSSHEHMTESPTCVTPVWLAFGNLAFLPSHASLQSICLGFRAASSFFSPFMTATSLDTFKLVEYADYGYSTLMDMRFGVQNFIFLMIKTLSTVNLGKLSLLVLYMHTLDMASVQHFGVITAAFMCSPLVFQLVAINAIFRLVNHKNLHRHFTWRKVMFLSLLFLPTASAALPTVADLVKAFGTNPKLDNPSTDELLQFVHDVKETIAPHVSMDLDDISSMSDNACIILATFLSSVTQGVSKQRIMAQAKQAFADGKTKLTAYWTCLTNCDVSDDVNQAMNLKREVMSFRITGPDYHKQITELELLNSRLLVHDKHLSDHDLIDQILTQLSSEFQTFTAMYRMGLTNGSTMQKFKRDFTTHLKQNDHDKKVNGNGSKNPTAFAVENSGVRKKKNNFNKFKKPKPKQAQASNSSVKNQCKFHTHPHNWSDCIFNSKSDKYNEERAKKFFENKGKEKKS